MDSTENGVLKKKYLIENKYEVILFIKQGRNTETYRVKSKDGKLYFLKLFNIAKLHRTDFAQNGDLLEIEYLKKVKHNNIVSYKDSGEMIYEGKKYIYLILDFIVGETLLERTSREPFSNIYDVKLIANDILEGLKYLHDLPECIIHNEITPKNVMLDLSGDIPKGKIINFGYARSFTLSTKAFNKEGLNIHYLASECFNNLYSRQSDIYSTGAIIYQLIFDIPPWFKDVSKFNKDQAKLEEAVLQERKKPLLLPDIENEIFGIDNSLLKVLKKALSHNPEKRFQTADEFLKAINGEIEVEDVTNDTSGVSKNLKNNVDEAGAHKENLKHKGFNAIAGMQDLKNRLMNDVIELINDPEGATKYNISMPNGMLLYGPPGCGKTFFAEKFAEETGFGYKYVNPSELGSIYIHGTQGKIARLFKEARENAPYIICLDEVSSIFPSRESANNHQVGEVDEFLTQLNNCGKDGVFVIAMTNFPEIIDEAVLRAGRLDIKIYVPPPDFEARKALFEMYLKDIPKEFGIDYDQLAKITENYVSSDIKLVIEEVSRALRKSRGRVSMEMLEAKIKTKGPSVEMHTLKKHESYRKKVELGSVEDNSNSKLKIGFRT